MRKLLISSIFVALTGCSAGGASDNRVIQLTGDLPIAETVNGTPVPQALAEALARAHNADLTVPEQRAEVLRLLSDYVLLAEQAKRDGLLAKPQFAADVELARLVAQANATMVELQKQTPLTDDALKAEYDARVTRAGKVDYDFSQLLFAKEDDALKAAGELIAGKTFAQVYDEWKDKAANAGVFTHRIAEQLPDNLVQALAAMKNGDTTHAPIKSQYGWHVVRLDAINPITPPPFAQVKESIRASLSKKIGEQRLAKLKEQAKIEYPPGSAPPPAARTEPPGTLKPAAATPAESAPPKQG
jgi:peptidyl-prolyl cis-trans isomerase C